MITAYEAQIYISWMIEQSKEHLKDSTVFEDLVKTTVRYIEEGYDENAENNRL